MTAQNNYFAHTFISGKISGKAHKPRKIKVFWMLCRFTSEKKRRDIKKSQENDHFLMGNCKMKLQ